MENYIFWKLVFVVLVGFSRDGLFDYGILLNYEVRIVYCELVFVRFRWKVKFSNNLFEDKSGTLGFIMSRVGRVYVSLWEGRLGFSGYY